MLTLHFADVSINFYENDHVMFDFTYFWIDNAPVYYEDSDLSPVLKNIVYGFWF